MDTLDQIAIEEENLPHGRKNEYLLVFLLAFVGYLASVDSMLLMPLINDVIKTFKVSAIESTLLVSSYSIMAFLAGIFSAGIMDQFDRKKLLIYTFIGFTIGTALCGFAYDFHLFILYRGIAGIFGGIIGGVITAIVSDLIPFERRATAISIISLSFAVAAITGIPFGLSLASEYDIQMPFKVLAVISVLTFFALIVWIPPVNEHLKHVEKTKIKFTYAKEVFKDGNQLRALLLAFLLVFGHQVVITFIVPYFENNIGFNEHIKSLMYAVGGIATVIASPIIGKICDKKGNLPSFIVLLLLSFIPIWLSTNIKEANLYFAFGVCIMFFIFAAGRIIPAYTIMTGATTPEKRGGFMSLRSAFLELGSGVAALVCGVVVSITPEGRVENFNHVGYISIISGIICIFIALRIKIVSHK
ncbi:MAG: MFS transporter [Chitinophagales bacterium]|nr:MFS transporter [Chitinophagales bacterium]